MPQEDRRAFSRLDSMADCSLSLATWYFRTVWRRVARAGGCDALDSAEYRRVERQWIRAYAPVPAEPFIRDHANAPAGSPLLKEGGQ